MKRESLEAQLREDERLARDLVEPKKKKKKKVILEDEYEEEETTPEMEALARSQRTEEAKREAQRILWKLDEENSDEEEGSDVSGDLDLGVEIDDDVAVQGRTLADIILAKIAEKERPVVEEEDPLPAKVVEAYSGMAPVLARYRAGKLPKAFKVIPSLERWDEVLWLTRPDSWSPHCVLAATRVFASNLDPARAKIYYTEVLLPRCREDIKTHKKLNYHLYQALHKALFKPAAWFKGILLPLASEGATLREALIIGSILSKASVPPAHAAVVMMKLAEFQHGYSGACCVFLIVLLNKKYSLPLRVLAALVAYFDGFAEDEVLPVLWHQSLLVFVQRYKADLTDAHKLELRAVVKRHTHHEISAAIRAELDASTSMQLG